MTDTLSTVWLCVLTCLSVCAFIAAVRSGARARDDASDGAQRMSGRLPGGLIWAILIGGAGLFIYRAAAVHKGWQPVEAHVDGLVLMAVLFAAVVLYLRGRAHIRGLHLFAPPLLTLLLAWAICASAWTFHPFGPINSVWTAVHLGSVYGGMAFFAVAAIAGVMYLYVQRKLRTTHDPAATRPFASLEATERLIIRTSAVGFALLTVGLITGLIIVASEPDQKLGAGWWYSPKVVLAAAVWVIYALVMNVRHTTNFRGARAAWLSIAGLVLLIATFGAATALPTATPKDKAPAQDAPPQPAGESSAPRAPALGGAGGYSNILENVGMSGHAWRVREAMVIAFARPGAGYSNVLENVGMSGGTLRHVAPRRAIVSAWHGQADSRQRSGLPVVETTMRASAPRPNAAAWRHRLPAAALAAFAPPGAEPSNVLENVGMFNGRSGTVNAARSALADEATASTTRRVEPAAARPRPPARIGRWVSRKRCGAAPRSTRPACCADHALGRLRACRPDTEGTRCAS